MNNHNINLNLDYLDLCQAMIAQVTSKINQQHRIIHPDDYSLAGLFERSLIIIHL
ncbi:hypothetical protein [Nostoc sp.]|uniref:hypothetical protein n=1 Tax=Nostoc sp. TaxID=1180 RepID=UPI002FF7F781